MTPKQQLRSLEAKMKRLQERNPDIDMNICARHFLDIERYYKLQREHFYLKFEINNYKNI